MIKLTDYGKINHLLDLYMFLHEDSIPEHDKRLEETSDLFAVPDEERRPRPNGHLRPSRRHHRR